LLGEFDVDADEELADSALGELGNVVGSAFLNDLADRFSLRIKPSPPAVGRDMIGALLATLAAALAADERQELPAVRAQLPGNGNGEECNAYLLWIPGHRDLERLERLACRCRWGWDNIASAPSGMKNGSCTGWAHASALFCATRSGASRRRPIWCFRRAAAIRPGRSRESTWRWRCRICWSRWRRWAPGAKTCTRKPPAAPACWRWARWEP